MGLTQMMVFGFEMSAVPGCGALGQAMASSLGNLTRTRSEFGANKATSLMFFVCFRLQSEILLSNKCTVVRLDFTHLDSSWTTASNAQNLKNFLARHRVPRQACSYSATVTLRDRSFQPAPWDLAAYWSSVEFSMRHKQSASSGNHLLLVTPDTEAAHAKAAVLGQKGAGRTARVFAAGSTGFHIWSPRDCSSVSRWGVKPTNETPGFR